jgi:hypothetical protein
MAGVHNFQATFLTIGGFQIAGFSDGGTIEFTPQPHASFTTGADGKLTITKTADRHIAVKVTLKATSQSVKVLDGFLRASRLSPTALPLPFSYIDPNQGNTYSGNAFMLGMDAVSIGKEAGDVVFNLVLEYGADSAVHGALNFG